MKKLILGSSSPRRQEMLAQLDIPFSIRIPTFDESTVTITDPLEKVEKLALLKARHIPLRSKQEIILTADTIVTYEGEIFEKPTDQADAYRMLRTLSGTTHEVITAFVLRTQDEEKVFSVRTNVYFWELTEAEINAYIATEEPYDKAGGYGIQGRAGLFVKKIDGDYYNVVGLPISYVIKALRNVKFPVDHYVYEI